MKGKKKETKIIERTWKEKRRKRNVMKGKINLKENKFENK
jgi:hypothetical protein